MAGPVTVSPVFRNESGPGDLPDRLITLFEDVCDVAFFYFVGHGQIDMDNQLCLGLVRSRPNASRRAATSLQFQWVRRAMLDSPAATKILILDCCFAGPASRPANTLGTSDELIDMTVGTGAYVMAACGAYESAWFETDVKAPQTYFTKYMADLVEAGIPGEPAGLRLHPMFIRLRENLVRDRRPVPTSRSVDEAKDFVFAFNVAPPEAQVDKDLEIKMLTERLAMLEKALAREADGSPSVTLGFAGEQYDDRRMLATAMTVEADRAAEWLKDGGAAKLRNWLATFEDHPFDVVHLVAVERDEWRAHLAVGWFAVAFLRDQRPHFRGVPIDLDGILRLAQDPGSWGFLYQVVDRDVLRIAALHDCAHPRCAYGPCAELRDLGGRIAGAATQAMERLSVLGPRLAGDTLAADVFGAGSLVHPHDIIRFYARAAEVLVSPEGAQWIAKTAHRDRLPRAGWWQDVARAAACADHRTADGAAAIIVAAEMADRARAYRRGEDCSRQMTRRQRIIAATSAFSRIGQ